MFGWRRALAIRASRTKRVARPRFWRSDRTTLSATCRPVMTCRAANTSPMPPRPMSRSTSKRPFTRPLPPACAKLSSGGIPNSCPDDSADTLH